MNAASRWRQFLPEFQYPLADRVGFWGARLRLRNGQDRRFQYPLADRVGFWGARWLNIQSDFGRFSILLRIELVFGA